MARSIPSEPQEAELRQLSEAVSDGLAIFSDGRLVWANAVLAALAGVERPEELAGRSVKEFFGGEGSRRPELARGKPIECRLLRPDGEARTVVVSPVAKTSSDGRISVAVRDVTALRALEAEVFERELELDTANHDRAAFRERLRRESADREELLTVVSHELRTPVTVIAGYNRILLSEQIGSLSEEQRRFLTESQKSCQKLNAFIGNLLERAREAVGEGDLELCVATIAPTLRAVVAGIEPLLRERGLKISLAVDPATPRARFDPPRVEQVLTNLLGNAVRFAPAGSSIELVARGVGTRRCRFVEVAVGDAGPGVELADRQRIFEPYVRRGEASGAGGLGLGLAICKRIVEAHGGQIRVADRPGGGSLFVFTLPAAPVAEASS